MSNPPLNSSQSPSLMSSSSPSTSSPIRASSSYVSNNQKERRNPSITPRKFTRFFTPRSTQSTTVDSTRRSLFEASNSRVNRNGVRSSPVYASRGQENSPTRFAREFKRRKLVQLVEKDCASELSVTSCVAPYSFTGLEEHKDTVSSSQTSFDSAIDMQHDEHYMEEVESEQMDIEEEQEVKMNTVKFQLPERRIQRLEDRGLSGRVLGVHLSRAPRSRKQRYEYPVHDYQDDTATYYSRPADVHSCSQQRPTIEPCIPFCATTCNTNSLVAIGDERGRVRLVDSSLESKASFNDVHLAFHAHHNAIIDMSFTEDDSRLVTGSGDQRVQVIDMKEQRPISEFEDKHTASVKAVRFQPGQANNDILATCSRDGNINIYDMRCRTTATVARIESHNTDALIVDAPKIRTVNSMVDAHSESRSGPRFSHTPRPNWRAFPRQRHIPASRLESEAVSVTSIAFLPAGGEHLLLSTSEYDSTIKLWDIRAIPRRGQHATALAQTAPPDSHTSYRQVGLTSLAVSGDGSRFYASARDNAIYAYSTSHLMLGHAPELEASNYPRSSALTRTQRGLKPMYAFRHPMLLIASFYIKLALRKANAGRAEMLACGSTDHCAVIFPTDEKHLTSRKPNHSRFYDNTDDANGAEANAAALTRRVRNERCQEREEGKLVVSERGTALVEGHQREVSSVAWTRDGDLIGVSDDAVVRVWREGRSGEARSLREAGNVNGMRWGCGWADVEREYDVVDEDFEEEEEPVCRVA